MFIPVVINRVNVDVISSCSMQMLLLIINEWSKQADILFGCSNKLDLYLCIKLHLQRRLFQSDYTAKLFLTTLYE